MSSWIVPAKSYTKELFRARRGVNAADLIILSPPTVEPHSLSETQLPSLGKKRRERQAHRKKRKRNKLASLEATLVRNHDPLTDSQG